MVIQIVDESNPMVFYLGRWSAVIDYSSHLTSWMSSSAAIERSGDLWSKKWVRLSTNVVDLPWTFRRSHCSVSLVRQSSLTAAANHRAAVDQLYREQRGRRDTCECRGKGVWCFLVFLFYAVISTGKSVSKSTSKSAIFHSKSTTCEHTLTIPVDVNQAMFTLAKIT